MDRKLPNPVKIGERFGAIVVITGTGKRKHRNVIYKCKCDCGKYKEIVGLSLRAGATKSCGCLRVSMSSKPPGDAAWNRVFKSYIRDAKRRDLSFELSMEQFKSIASGKCTYCGDPPIARNHYKIESKKDITQHSVDRATIFINGVDRVDSSKGYTLTNCESCCTICNKMKLDKDKQVFINHVHKISNFMKSEMK